MSYPKKPCGSCRHYLRKNHRDSPDKYYGTCKLKDTWTHAATTGCNEWELEDKVKTNTIPFSLFMAFSGENIDYCLRKFHDGMLDSLEDYFKEMDRARLKSLALAKEKII